jgi:HAD superfamily hydrolase (TIGR01509 family)
LAAALLLAQASFIIFMQAAPAALRSNGGHRGPSVYIFDCNGVLVDSEPIATAVAAEELTRVGFSVSAEKVARFFAGRRPSDVLADIENAMGRKLPRYFGEHLANATLRRLRSELRPTAHVDHALTWLRGPKCVASSSPIERVRLSLEITGLLRFFDPYLFTATDIPRGKPAPDLFLHAAAKMHVAPADCIVVEDSPAGISAAHAAGMAPIGFIGGNHVNPDFGAQLIKAGARAVVADMRALKGTVVELRGW